MSWLWTGIILGLIAPWLLMGPAIRMAFEERGLVQGLGTWFGGAIISVPLMVGFCWLANILF